MKTKCLIILAYIETYNEEYVKNLTKEYDFIICADGGQLLAAKYNLQPNCIIGDFDSSCGDHIFGCEYIHYPAEKDITDTEACIIYAIENNFIDILLLGGLGGRLDHTLGNINLLKKYHVPGIQINMEDLNNHVTLLIDEDAKVKRSNHTYLSLIPYSEICRGVTAAGVKYPLQNAVLDKAATLGVSNEIVDRNAEISVKHGELLVIESTDFASTF